MRSIIEQYSKDLTFGRLAYAYDHFSRVYFYAKKIGESYDDEILHAACFLYKIILGKNSKEDSAERAEQILAEAGFNIKKIFKVKEAIMGSELEDKPELYEAKLLHDAIIIDNLGAIGFSRLSISSFFWQKAQKMKTVYITIKNYVEKVKDNICLESSKPILEERLHLTEEILSNMEKELKII